MSSYDWEFEESTNVMRSEELQTLTGRTRHRDGELPDAVDEILIVVDVSDAAADVYSDRDPPRRSAPSPRWSRLKIVGLTCALLGSVALTVRQRASHSQLAVDAQATAPARAGRVPTTLPAAIFTPPPAPTPTKPERAGPKRHSPHATNGRR